MAHQYPLGFLIRSKKTYNLNIEKNTDDLIRNYLILDFMGGGKTNLAKSMVTGQDEAFKETKGKYGTIPIVFITKYEWSEMGLASKDDNIAPNREPKDTATTQITFPICDKPEHITNQDVCSIDFTGLTVEDIGSFADMHSKADLGFIKRILKGLQKKTIKFFLQALEEQKQKGDALYYIFDTLNEKGLFDTDKYPPFDWKREIRKSRPIIFNLGKITNNIFQGLGGFLFRELYKLADWVYQTVILKKNKIDEAKQLGQKIDLELTEEELWYYRNFWLSIFIDETPRLLFNTTSSNLANFPAHYYFQIMSSNDGRKLRIKYTVLITQFFKDIYFKFRKRSKYLILGNRVTKEDKDFMLTEKILHQDDVYFLLANSKHSFTLLDFENYQNLWDFQQHRLRNATKITAYRSPCGVR